VSLDVFFISKRLKITKKLFLWCNQGIGLSKLERSKLKRIYKLLLLKKNIAMSSQEIIKIEDDFTLIRFQNDGSEVFNAQRSKQWTDSVSFWTKGSQIYFQPR
jgi:hypothetical protein